jgi:hypothetical protein
MSLENNYNPKSFEMKVVAPHTESLEFKCDPALIYQPYTNLSAQTALFIKRFGLDCRMFEPRGGSLGSKRSFP